MSSVPPTEHFDELYMPVPESGCWIWLRGVDKDGYGKAQVDNRHTRAHRLSYQMHKGEIGEGLCVCHKCDVTSCVNPNHLFLATNPQNTEDKRRKGRARGSHKLTMPFTHCKRGHEYAVVGVYMSNGCRVCKECCRLRNRGELH